MTEEELAELHEAFRILLDACGASISERSISFACGEYTHFLSESERAALHRAIARWGLPTEPESPSAAAPGLQP